MATKELFTAILTLFNAGNDFNTAVSGQLAAYKAKDDASSPHSVMTLISDGPEYTFTGNNLEVAQVQFSIYDNSAAPDTIMDTQQKLWDLFDDAIIAMTGFTELAFIRGQTLLRRGEVDRPEIWASHTVYEVTFQKT
ncbi:hypothetical protein KAR91_88515 [Candidatus Pacearchaeota archaeon]|nr:hypothetical protein [Candidatus Pacearchaeota archaeon]